MAQQLSFSQSILSWYAQHKRELPWRKRKDPYAIWLSEIILQQTRVAQGLPYFERFLAAFPTVKDLAEASEQEVLKLWQGLGYYSRARNLHATAQYVAFERKGKFPGNYLGLLELKGVGQYTAAAIASFCYNEPQAVVDGNVYRVLSRYFGVKEPIDKPQGMRYFRELANSVMDADHIADYNQGIMEFGALQCTPKSPNCGQCPLSDSCVAYAQGTIDKLPLKAGKIKVKKRHFNYLVPLDVNGGTLMTQRQGAGIWEGLYEFPLLETDQALSLQGLREEVPKYFSEASIRDVSLFNPKPMVHKLSHQHLYASFWVIEIEGRLKGGIAWDQLQDYPVPVLLDKFMGAFKNLYF